MFGIRLVIVGAHHDRVSNRHIGVNDAAQANDRVVDVGFKDAAAVAHEDVVNVAVVNRRSGQEARMGVDWPFGIEKVKRRIGARHLQVHLIEAVNRPDIFPETVENVADDPVGMNRGRNNMLTKVNAVIVIEQVNKHFQLKDVDAHGSHIRPFSIIPAFQSLPFLGRLGLLRKAHNLIIGVQFQNT